MDGRVHERVIVRDEKTTLALGGSVIMTYRFVLVLTPVGKVTLKKHVLVMLPGDSTHVTSSRRLSFALLLLFHDAFVLGRLSTLSGCA